MDDLFMSVQISHYRTLIKNYFDRVTKEIDITMAHAPYIMVLHKKGRLTQSELTKTLGFDKSNSSRVIADLYNKGMISVLKEDRIYIALTDKGRAVSDKITALKNDWERRAFEGVSKEDIEIYHQVSKKMKENIKGIIGR